jgi:hypothetical protein
MRYVPVRSGQVHYSAEIQDHEGQSRKTFESEQNEGAQMGNELESERAMVVILRAIVAI